MKNRNSITNRPPSTIKKIILAGSLALCGAVGVSLLSSPPAAQASPWEDQSYVACVGDNAFSYSGPSAMAAAGHSFATDISYGLRTPYQEQQWVYANTSESVTQYESNVMVNCATHVWLGYSGPDG
jgi:hypothetical protein